MAGNAYQTLPDANAKSTKLSTVMRDVCKRPSVPLTERFPEEKHLVSVSSDYFRHPVVFADQATVLGSRVRSVWTRW